MNILQNKKALCFLALPHHNKLLVPVMQNLQEQGMQIQYCTAAAEAAFELTLLEVGLSYVHAQDYMEVVQFHIDKALSTIMPQWQQLFLTNATLRGVALPIQDKILMSAIENVFCFDKMVEQTKPDIIFALHELNPWGKILGYISHKYKIPYVTFQEGLFYTSIPYNRFHTDYSTACVVWGEVTKQLLIAAGNSDEKIVMLGHVGLEKAKEQALSVHSIRHTKELLHINDGQRMVVIFPSHAHYKPFAVPVFIKWLKEHQDVVVVFKWHPTAEPKNIAEAMGPLQKCANVRSLCDEKIEAYALMGAASVCITIGATTTGLEIAYFNKPFIEAPLPGPRHLSFFDEQVADAVGGFEYFGPAIEKALHDEMSDGRLGCINKYLDKHFAYRDDKTIARISDMVHCMFEVQKPMYAKESFTIAQEDYGEYVLLYRVSQYVKAKWKHEALQAAIQTDAAIVGGLQINKSGLVHHIGYAFNGNQTPVSLYRMLPPEQPMFSRRREFEAIQFPFLIKNLASLDLMHVLHVDMLILICVCV